MYGPNIGFILNRIYNDDLDIYFAGFMSQSYLLYIKIYIF